MADQRNTEPRKQIGHHLTKQFKKLFKEVMLKPKPEDHASTLPYGAMEFVCCADNLPVGMKECPPGDFPHNIKKWIWTSLQCDEASKMVGVGDFWECIVELAPEAVYEGTRYAYFQASHEEDICGDNECKKKGVNGICDESHSYTAGTLLVVSDIRHCIEFLAPGPYARYMEETEPAESWS